MIEFTERAVIKVRQLESELTDGNKLLRVFVEAGGCSGFEYGMSFDEPKADDAVLECNGIRVLMDPTSGSYLNGCRVDFDDGLQGKGFEIINPNAQSTCGCGRSFN